MDGYKFTRDTYMDTYNTDIARRATAGGILQSLKDAGFAVDSEPRQGSDHNWQAWVKDPNGIRIELMKIDPQSPQAAFDR